MRCGEVTLQPVVEALAPLQVRARPSVISLLAHGQCRRADGHCVRAAAAEGKRDGVLEGRHQPFGGLADVGQLSQRDLELALGLGKVAAKLRGEPPQTDAVGRRLSEVKPRSRCFTLIEAPAAPFGSPCRRHTLAATQSAFTRAGVAARASPGASSASSAHLRPSAMYPSAYQRYRSPATNSS